MCGDNRFIAKKDNFEKIPGIPVAYWVGENAANAYVKGSFIKEYVDTFQRIITGDNEKFLRLWYEVDASKIPFHPSDMAQICLDCQYWIPYNKGGEFRKCYGGSG